MAISDPRDAVAEAIKKGRLIRLPCEVCGAVNVQAHHPDYRKPLKVRWLCRKHHGQEHVHLRRLGISTHQTKGLKSSMHLKVTKELWTALTEIAKAERRTRHRQVLVFLEDGVAQKENGNVRQSEIR